MTKAQLTRRLANALLDSNENDNGPADNETIQACLKDALVLVSAANAGRTGGPLDDLNRGKDSLTEALRRTRLG